MEKYFRELGNILSSAAEEVWETANEKERKDSEAEATILAQKLQQEVSKRSGAQQSK